jgi:hypothetical protein
MLVTAQMNRVAYSWDDGWRGDCSLSDKAGDRYEQIHELSRGDLAEVSGGLRNFPTSTALTPFIPIPPPEGYGPVVPPGAGPFRPSVANLVLVGAT